MAGPEDALGTIQSLASGLRARGVPVTIDQLLACAHGVAELRATTPRALYLIGRASLVSNEAHLAAYDAAFDDLVAEAAPEEVHRSAGAAPAPAPAAGQEPGSDDGSGGDAGAAASALERLDRKDLATCTEEELETLRRAIAATAFVLPSRPARRSRRAARGRLDLRRTARRALRAGDAAWDLDRRRRRDRPRRIVLLLDVSGSMGPYARVLLSVAHVLARRGAPVDTYCFATRVTRVTGALAARDPDTALARASELVADWDGGTRIGECLRAFLTRWGRPGAARGAVVVICSDGLERGDPAVLAEQAARLRRLARRVVWFNPLRADAGYEPVQRGIVAALPHADAHLPGRDVADVLGLLRDLERALA